MCDTILHYTNQLYFGQYLFKVKFSLPHLSAAKSRTGHGLFKAIQLRKKYLSVAKEGINGTLFNSLMDITNDQEQHLYNFIEDFSDPKFKSGKMVISMYNGIFYHNNASLTEDIKRLLYLNKVQVFQCVPQCGADEIYLTNNKFQYRSYFKNIYNKNLINSILDLSTRNGLCTSKAIGKKGSYQSIRSNYFVDHNTMSDLTMLHLIAPGCVRKTVKIVNDK